MKSPKLARQGKLGTVPHGSFCHRARSSSNLSLLRAAKLVVDVDDLDEVLCEFDAVIEDFTSPMEKRHFRYDEHLRIAKRRSSASVSDSGISDTESELKTKCCILSAWNDIYVLEEKKYSSKRLAVCTP